MAPSLAAGLVLALQLGSADEAAIRNLYKTFDEAFEKQDTDALEPLFAPDYVATLADGSQNVRDAALADIREEAAMALPPIHCREQVKKVAVTGDAAVVSISEETSYQVRGNDGKAYGYRYTDAYEDHLIKADGRWRFRETRYAKGGEEQLDGRPIPAGQLRKVLATLGTDDWQIRELYAHADQAFEKKDAAAFVAPYAPDWVLAAGDEVVPHDGALAALRREVDAALTPRRHVEVKRLTVNDNLATAQVECTTSYGAPGADGKVHAVRLVEPFEEQLTRRDGRWLIEATRRLDDGSEAQLDGRRVSRAELKALVP